MRLLIVGVEIGMTISVAAIVWCAFQLHRSAQKLKGRGMVELARIYIGSAWLLSGLAVTGFCLTVDLLIRAW